MIFYSAGSGAAEPWRAQPSMNVCVGERVGSRRHALLQSWWIRLIEKEMNKVYIKNKRIN